MFSLPKNTNSRAFSLIELLTVVAIVSLMMTIATPALMSSFRGSSVTHAGNKLADLATLARQTAASRNEITAVILTTKASASPTDKQSAILMEYDIASQTWKQAGNWIHLPESIVAAAETADADTPKKFDQNFAPPKRGGQVVDKYTSLVFYPDGRMDNPADSPKVSVTYAQGTQNSPNHYDLVFNKETSAFRIVRP